MIRNSRFRSKFRCFADAVSAPVPVLISVICAATFSSMCFVTQSDAVMCGTEAGKGCVIKFALRDAVELSNIQFSTSYVSADGELDGSGRSVACASAVGGALAAFRDKEDLRLVESAIIRVGTFAGPREISACCFTYGLQPPLAGNFSITVTDAGRPSAVPGEVEEVFPRPRMRISAIECPGSLPDGLSTTTTTTTSTTNSSTSTTFVSTSTTLAVAGRCGFPQSDGDKPLASDALFVLQAGVKLRSCAVCICDMDGNGTVAASDALATLRASVGLPTDFLCPLCE